MQKTCLKVVVQKLTVAICCDDHKAADVAFSSAWELEVDFGGVFQHKWSNCSCSVVPTIGEPTITVAASNVLVTWQDDLISFDYETSFPSELAFKIMQVSVYQIAHSKWHIAGGKRQLRFRGRIPLFNLTTGSQLQSVSMYSEEEKEEAKHSKINNVLFACHCTMTEQQQQQQEQKCEATKDALLNNNKKNHVTLYNLCATVPMHETILKTLTDHDNVFLSFSLSTDNDDSNHDNDDHQCQQQKTRKITQWDVDALSMEQQQRKSSVVFKFPPVELLIPLVPHSPLQLMLELVIQHSVYKLPVLIFSHLDNPEQSITTMEKDGNIKNQGVSIGATAVQSKPFGFVQTLMWQQNYPSCMENNEQLLQKAHDEEWQQCLNERKFGLAQCKNKKDDINLVMNKYIARARELRSQQQKDRETAHQKQFIF
jgi:hypothetical protein